MRYLFDLRLNGLTLQCDEQDFASADEVIDHAVQVALSAGIPGSKLWVINDDGVVLVMGAKAAQLTRNRRSCASGYSNDNLPNAEQLVV